MYHTTSLASSSWASIADHCSWSGVTCGMDWENETQSWYRVTELKFNHSNWSGPYFSNFHDLKRLELLKTNGNSLIGDVPSNLCTVSTTTDLHISGDESNCPNIPTNSAGCCDEVKLSNPSPYLNSIVKSVLGSDECDTLSASDQMVCNFMKIKDNHQIFQDDEQYPDPNTFPYDGWLKVSSILVSSFWVGQIIVAPLLFLQSRLWQLKSIVIISSTIGTHRTCASFLWYIIKYS